jgi:hypothetical protein
MTSIQKLLFRFFICITVNNKVENIRFESSNFYFLSINSSRNRKLIRNRKAKNKL